ncbi:expressed unknown protein [Seminavis robusta]|uniref:EGF-like domain-containing protein n=1 Tax=Seminavis robusta TaxID=568900 RepID=A0A9N8DCJ4_9STRA|nr:expressed unknown protein [Seminavis robusta]|eukprot:Sro81_g043570.1 n/a (1313) ;mRNA; f:98747-103055
MTRSRNNNDDAGFGRVKEEVDVDSLLSNVELASNLQTKNSAKTNTAAHSGAPSLLDSLSPADIQTLALLLKPALIDHDNPNENRVTTDSPPEKSETSTRDDSSEAAITKEKDDTEWYAPFGESTYSLFCVCSINSLAFWYAAFVYVLQITTIVLTMIDVIDWNGDVNELWMSMPPMVDSTVTIAQGVTLFQAIAFQSDLIEAILKLHGGFHAEVLEKHPGATYPTWLVCCFAQLFAGLLLLVTIFVLIMQVDTVLDIMLNFAALEFMANIDDVAFSLAKAGFIGWATIVAFRTTGKFMCKTTIVNMGDDFVAALGAFNGMYDLDLSGNVQISGRGQYVERRSVEIDTPGRGIFGYCSEISAWTFRVESYSSNENEGPCDWVARSSQTDTYDITEAVGSPWFVRDDSLHEVVLEPFSLFCFDCTRKGMDGSDECGGKGTCSNAVCDCEDGWYGLRCEFVSPCPWITIDARTEKFASTRDWASDYQSIELTGGAYVEAYHRPIYIHEYESGDYDVVMFTGGRWVLSSSKFLPNGGRIQASDLLEGQIDVGSDIGNFFQHSYHAYKGFSGNLSVAFLSGFMKLGTEGDLSSPVGFHWYHAEEATADYKNQGTGKLVDTEFLCHTCDDDSNPCLYNGICIEGRCQCSYDSFGSLCEIPPVGNGHCDPFFNVPEFQMDGGDCCDFTCKSTSEYVCGTDDHGYVSMGYFYCDLPDDEWQSYYVNGDPGSFSGYDIDLVGTSVAIAEPAQGRVRVYDKFGSSSILRDTIFGLGVRVKISSGPFNVVSNPSFKAPIEIAIQLFEPYHTLQIFKCLSNGCTQTQELPNVFDFDLSKDGTVLAVSVSKTDDLPTHLQVYESIEGIFQFRANITIARDNINASLLSISLDHDGSRLAVQSQLSQPGTQNALTATKGYVDVMVWNGVSRVYEIEAEFPFASRLSAMEYQLSLRLSEDGSVLAFGIPECLEPQLQVRVRKEEENWVARSSPAIDSTGCVDSANFNSNNALALSSNGSRVAFRVGTNVSVFDWDSETEVWADDVETISHLTAYSVSMSADGTGFAVGAPQDGSGGVTEIFYLPERKECPGGTSLLRISLTVDSVMLLYISWKLLNKSTGEVMFEQGPYGVEYQWATFVEEACVPTDSCYTFSIYNKIGQGLVSPAQYALFLDGEKALHGTFDGLFERKELGRCDSCPPGTERFRVMMLSCAPVSWKLRGTTNQVATNGTYFDTLAQSGDGFVVDVSCSAEWFNDTCTDWSYYETCLDPQQCYAFKTDSNPEAFLEVDAFGDKRVKGDLICFGDALIFGNLHACDERIWKVLHSEKA